MTRQLKTIKAENITRRVPIAWGGTEAKPLAQPVHATAYKVEDGTILIAIVESAHTGNIEVGNAIRVRISYDLSAVASVRMCHTCDADNPHPRRITPHNGKGFCDESAKRSRAARKGKAKGAWKAERAEAKAEQRDLAVTRVLGHVPPSREAQQASVLRARAIHHGADSSSFRAMATLYGLTQEQAIELAGLTPNPSHETELAANGVA